ncbi:MAG: hypothetical protein KF716_19035 [Anaerolineae bacterium]|nr:hypothetical protein [Anaerolineae bacterium]
MNTVIRRVLFLGLTTLLVAALFGLPSTANAVRFTGRVTNDNYALCYRVPVDAGRALNVSMIALSGDLAPFVVLRNADGSDTLKRPDEGTDTRSALTYTADASGEVEIVATRADLADGTTSGEFLLLVEGSDTVEAPTAPAEPCLATQPALFTSDDRDESLELPRPKTKNGEPQPAVLLPINTTVTGVINNQSYVVYYLIDATQARSYKIEMFRSQTDGGDLLPFMGILQWNDLGKVLKRAKNRSDTSTSIEFNPQDFPDSEGERWFVLAVSRVDVENGTTTGKYQLSVRENQAQP